MTALLWVLLDAFSRDSTQQWPPPEVLVFQRAVLLKQGSRKEIASAVFGSFLRCFVFMLPVASMGFVCMPFFHACQQTFSSLAIFDSQLGSEFVIITVQLLLKPCIEARAAH